MTSIASAVEAYATPALAPELGGGSKDTGRRRDALEADLLRVSRTNTTYFNISVGAVLATLVAAAAITLKYIGSPDAIKAIFGVLGISVSGLLALLASLWREKVRADMLLVLVRNVDEEQLRKVIDVLMSKL